MGPAPSDLPWRPWIRCRSARDPSAPRTRRRSSKRGVARVSMIPGLEREGSGGEVRRRWRVEGAARRGGESHRPSVVGKTPVGQTGLGARKAVGGGGGVELLVGRRWAFCVRRTRSQSHRQPVSHQHGNNEIKLSTFLAANL